MRQTFHQNNKQLFDDFAQAVNINVALRQAITDYRKTYRLNRHKEGYASYRDYQESEGLYE